jgi:hypothetical protein
MKSTVLLISSIVFISLLSAEVDVVDNIGVRHPNLTLPASQNTYDDTPTLSQIVKRKLSKAVTLIDREEQSEEGVPNTPIALFLLTGLFGFAFWGRISIRGKNYS